MLFGVNMMTYFRIMDYFPQVLSGSEVSLDPDTKISMSSPECHVQLSTQDEEKTDNIVLVFIESGILRTGQAIQLGPSPNGTFLDVIARSIYINKVAVEKAYHGQTVTVALKFPEEMADLYISTGSLFVEDSALSMTPQKKKLGSTIEDNSSDDLLASTMLSSGSSPASGSVNRILLGRKRGAGLVILPSEITTRAHYTFDAEVLILNHPNSVGKNYEPVVHTLCVRQCAR